MVVHRAAAQQGRSGAGVIELVVLARSVLKVRTNLNTLPLVQFARKILHLRQDLFTVLVQPEYTGTEVHVTVALRVQQVKRVLSSVSYVQ